MRRNWNHWLPKSLLITATLWSTRLQAESYTLKVESRSDVETSSTTGVWNISTGLFHPKLEVTDWNDGGLDTDTDIEVGDGSDGAFNISTYSQFSKNGDVSGNIIRIDTDDHPTLNFTSFTLNSGWTIRPTGSGILDIRSLSTINVNGTIDCSGDDGDDITHLDDTALADGATGVCGGGDGGDGGTSSTSSVTGGSSGTVATGGTGGAATTAANGGSGGGGGGGYSQVLGTDGTDPSASGGEGAAGTSQAPADNAFTIEGGGAGGGGGGVYDVADADNSNGAGGGAGGGTVYLTAVGDITIAATGSVLADGGDGGSAGAGLGKGGAGGGGAGGSIRILSMGEVTLAGPVTALEGNGGTSDGGDGGDGARGRTWITDSSGGADCFPTGNTDNPQSILTLLGCVHYRLGDFSITTKSIDLENTSPTLKSYTTVSNVPGASTLDIFFKGGSSFTNSLSSASGEREIKIRFDLNNDDDTNPATLTQFNLTYKGTKKEVFELKGACGSSDSSSTSNLAFFFLPLFFGIFMRYQSK
ncbi:MAG: hypothetical protein KDD25_05995 [Bdellovibrionales bacterium]|nr:hypothetical protein [Bdellovibrionales bacterium]